MIGRDLAYVALVTRDPGALTGLLGSHLGLIRTEIATGHGDQVPLFAVGQSALAVLPVGHAYVEGATRPGVHHIGLEAADLAAAVSATEAAGVSCSSTGLPSLGGGQRRHLDPAMTAGVASWLVPPIDRGRGGSAVIERFDHLGIASADNQAAMAAWVQRLGAPLESQQTDMEVAIAVESFTSDKYGVIYHSRPPVPVGGLRVTFITVGDTELEFLQNFDPRQAGEVDRGASGTTRQDQGAIAKFVTARGPGLHHVAFKTPDIDGVLSSLERSGVPTIDKKGRPGSRRGRIGFIDPKATGGVLLHFVERA